MFRHPLFLLFLLLLTVSNLKAQNAALNWSEFPSLPDPSGFAGMYAGVSEGTLIAMGGANFPNGYPWEGGKKKWYDNIYVLTEQKNWIKLDQKLPQPAGYGVSVSYKNEMIIAGGCTDTEHLKTVTAYRWDGKKLVARPMPDLPVPLAYMTGGVLQDVLVVLGGSESPSGSPTKHALILDLTKPSEGWKTLSSWPGRERILPVCGVWNNQLFLMGGETTSPNGHGNKYRDILLDNYSLSLSKSSGQWKAEWKQLATLPRGVTAAGNLPLLKNRFVIWGGVDAVTAQFRTPASHPGITRSLLYYYPENDTWEYVGEQAEFSSRVTLPVIQYNNCWLYVSGEIKPGIRTPKIVSVCEP